MCSSRLAIARGARAPRPAAPPPRGRAVLPRPAAGTIGPVCGPNSPEGAHPAPGTTTTGLDCVAGAASCLDPRPPPRGKQEESRPAGCTTALAHQPSAAAPALLMHSMWWRTAGKASPLPLPHLLLPAMLACWTAEASILVRRVPGYNMGWGHGNAKEKPGEPAANYPGVRIH